MKTRWCGSHWPPAAPHLQDRLTVEIGRLASVVYVRDLSGSEPRVIRGGIAVGLAAGESAPLPEQGVMANINLANVNVDAWEAVLGRAAGEGAAAAAGGPSPAPAAGSVAMGYLPTVIALRAKELTRGRPRPA